MGNLMILNIDVLNFKISMSLSNEGSRRQCSSKEIGSRQPNKIKFNYDSFNLWTQLQMMT